MEGSQRLLQLLFFDAGFVRDVQIALLKPSDLLRDSHGNKQVYRYALMRSKIVRTFSDALGQPKTKDLCHSDHRLFLIAYCESSIEPVPCIVHK